MVILLISHLIVFNSKEAVMKFYIMHCGFFQEIPASEIRHNATFFEVKSENGLNILKNEVTIVDDKPADNTLLSKIEPDKEQLIKVCGPSIFKGIPIGTVNLNNSWNESQNWYLRTEIVLNELYCYSWISKDSDEDAICISFEILKGKEEKK